MPKRIPLALFLSFLAGPAAGAAETLAIVHVSVIDVAAGSPAAALKRDQTVVVIGQTIQSVGPAARIAVPAGARVVDATGQYLIPGLQDMHVHCLIEGRPAFAFPMFVANGITGV